MSIHQFDTEVAAEVGLAAAVLAYSINYWCQHKSANNRDIKHGKAWVYNSAKAWSELNPYLTEKQVRTALNKLEKAGIIEVQNLNQKQYDQTRWYAYNGLQPVTNTANCPNGKLELPKRENAIAQMGKSNCPNGQTNTNDIPYNIPDTNVSVARDVPAPSSELDQALEAYQRVATKLKADNGGKTVWPSVVDFTPKRRAALKARIEKHGLPAWGEVLRKAAVSPHCLGDNNRGWVANFDFLTSQSGFTKTLEGNYDARHNPNSSVQGANASGQNASGLGAFERLDRRMAEFASGRVSDAEHEPDGGAATIIDITPTDGAGRAKAGSGNRAEVAGHVPALQGGT